MSEPKVFGVYTALFPFLDTGEAKIRPVVVISEPHGPYKVLAIVPISPRLVTETVDTVLAGWNSEGLLRPSVARVHRLTTILQADLVAELGVLSQKDRQALRDSLRSFLNL